MMRLACLWICVTAWVCFQAGCAVRSQHSPGAVDLEPFFRDVPEMAQAVDVLAVSPGMADVARGIRGRALADGTKLQLLLEQMLKRGLASIEYHPFTTLTAAETFDRRVGNCLSYTNLFVAIAREAGMHVQYQTVEIPPMWLSEGETIVRNTHINVLVRNARDNSLLGRDYAVDFNNVEYGDRYPVRQVDDNYAYAVYHGNLAVQHLTENDLDSALAQLWRALSIRPDLADLWVNLGVVRSRQGDVEAALSAYERALALDPEHPSALVDVAHVYERLGRHEDAEAARQRVTGFQRRNPYYHYLLANNAFQAADYRRSLDELAIAIDLNDDEYRFFGLQGQAHAQLGELALARESFEQAANLVRRSDLRARFDRKLELLEGGGP